MNTEQAKSAVRWVIATFGPFLIAHGYASSGTLELASGIIVSLVPLVWSMFVHTDTNAVAVVDTLAKESASPVQGVIVAPTAAGRELVDSIPGSKTVLAGSNAAVTMAKAA